LSKAELNSEKKKVSFNSF